MSLADLFPESFKRNLAERNITIGSAIIIRIPSFDIKYEKYAIYFADDCIKTECCGLVVINSPTEQILNIPNIRKNHVLIDCARHSFLRYDSYVDCTKIQSFVKESVVESITKDPTKFVGNVETSVMQEIYNVLLNSEVLSFKEKKRYSILEAS